MESKPWYASKLNWLGFFMIAQGIASGFGVSINADESAEITTSLINAIEGAAVIVLRAITSKPIRW